MQVILSILTLLSGLYLLLRALLLCDVIDNIRVQIEAISGVVCLGMSLGFFISSFL